MVFVAGPRQVGKTTLALGLPDARAGYLNWDVAVDRERILRRELPATGFWVFDELHKYRPWRNYHKGLYDSRQEGQQILVTGSGRLELFSFGGDSLQGRYHLLRLHPFSVAEAGVEDAEGLADLLRLGGFPEPYLGGNEIEARRWSRQNRTRLIEEDVTGTTSIRDLGRLEEMMLRLPDLVGSPLSINALREDLQVAHKTVASWLDTLERLFALFRLPPFGAPRIRAVKQERKHYHFDWSLVADPAARFENLLACHLLKWVHYEQDTQGRDLELRFFRDIDGREVDFVVMENRRPLVLVECKLSDRDIDRGLRYLKARFPGADARQIALYGERDYVTREGIRAMPALDFLRTLP
ncbi:MAG: ATP-binding protein [Gammaproteobacteria bacterium]|nr:ATP-binding protein [Gammaproteobacteria bacterium]